MNGSDLCTEPCTIQGASHDNGVFEKKTLNYSLARCSNARYRGHRMIMGCLKKKL